MSESFQTTYFYVFPDQVKKDRVRLTGDEARHALKVLRVGIGDELVVVDGQGGWYRIKTTYADKQSLEGQVVETRRDEGEPDYALTIGLALLKNTNRFEVFLEKAAELGVRKVVPLLTHRSERAHIKRERMQHILIAATKQSKRSRLVELAEPEPLPAFISAHSGGIICHETAGEEHTIRNALTRRPASDPVVILVGPEGGFTDEEVALAMTGGYQPVSLGPRRLRAETAAMVAAAAVLLNATS